MAIIDPEERALGPLLVLAVVWLDDVEYDADAVLVVVPDEALVGVGGISAHESVALVGAARLFVVGDLDARAGLQGVLAGLVLLGLLLHHLVDLSGGELLHLLLVGLVSDELRLLHGLVHELLVLLEGEGVLGQGLLHVVRVWLQLGH